MRKKIHNIKKMKDKKHAFGNYYVYSNLYK